MRAKQNQQSGKTVRFALLFFVFILLIVIGSFLVKGISVIQNSLFDGNHRFTILMQLEKEPQNVLLSFSPENTTASILYIKGKHAVDPQELGVILGVQIDAFVAMHGDTSLQKGNINAFLPALFQKITFKQDNIKTNMTFIDAVRLWMFVRKIPTHGVLEKTYIFPSNSEDNLDMGELDLLISSLFADHTIIEEKRSIQIINASGISGLGNRIARIVTNMGGNVIAVSTGDSVLPMSEIVYSEAESYTLEKLQRLFRKKGVSTDKQAISDIVVIVGKDKSSLFTIKQ